ncbi:MAG: phosphoribosyltransferase family protein [Patescibacteria group bacterium]
MEKLLTTLFGEKCYFCGLEGRIICYGCESKIKLCKNGVCIQCQKETVLGYTHPLCKKESVDKLPSQLCAVYEYGGMVSEIVKKSKYNPKSFVLLRLLSASGAKVASKLGFDFKDFSVVPIPISKSREKDRGFNQAEIIAKAVCKEFGLTMNNSILTRIRDTNKQFGLHKDERAQNITGAFAVKGDVADGKFLLVDDICTTGSTLIAGASSLFSAGAKDVRCFALSRKI